MEDAYYHSNNLNRKIDALRDIKVSKLFCFWSDLLGFGNIFFENSWELNIEDQTKIFNRLKDAHSLFLRNTSVLNEKSLILNDGLVKVSEIDENFHPEFFGLFLRSCIYTHVSIKNKENENGYPGPRSVLTFGESIKYLEEEIKFDDYVLNYTKPNPEGLSKIASENGNPTIVYNPSAFQMNTAFSKAYILDSLGSKYGISGSNIFVEQSVLEYSKVIAKELDLEVEEYTENNIHYFFLKKSKNRVYYGFQFDEKISIDYKSWQTTVYKLKSFYPHDEDIRDFKFEIEKM